MAIIILIITAIGYTTLLFLEPLGLKKFKSSRDVLLKSFICGFIYSLFLFFAFLIYDKNSLLELERIITHSSTASPPIEKQSSWTDLILSFIIGKTFIFSNIIWIVTSIIYSYSLKDKVDNWSYNFFITSGEKTFRSLSGKIVILNVKPNKLYTGVIKNFIDIDGEKGADFIELAPITTSYYNDDGDVKVKRYYSANESISHDSASENTILISTAEITQYREFESSLNVHFSGKPQSDESSITKQEILGLYSKLVQDSEKINLEKSLTSNIIEKINPEKFFNNKNKFLSLNDLESLQRISSHIITYFNNLDDHFPDKSIEPNVFKFVELLLTYSDTIQSKIKDETLKD